MANVLEPRGPASNLQIAQAAAMRPIGEVAVELGLDEDEYEPYGWYKAKIPPLALERRLQRPTGKLVAVTAITPTKFGEGKTTIAIGLTEALSLSGRRPVLCLREPSMGHAHAGSREPSLGAGRTERLAALVSRCRFRRAARSAGHGACKPALVSAVSRGSYVGVRG